MYDIRTVEEENDKVEPLPLEEVEAALEEEEAVDEEPVAEVEPAPEPEAEPEIACSSKSSIL